MPTDESLEGVRCTPTCYGNNVLKQLCFALARWPCTELPEGVAELSEFVGSQRGFGTSSHAGAV